MQKELYINARFLTQKTTGVQRFAIEICKELLLQDIKITFVAPRNILNPTLEKKWKVKTFGFFTSHIWEQIELPLYLKRNGNPLLLNLCNTAPIFYKNELVTIHDLAFKINPNWFSSSFAKVYNFIIPKISKTSHKIFTVSESSKKEIIELLKLEVNKIEVIYNGVTFRENKTEKSDALEKTPYILSVSSLDPRKNLNNLISAFEIANKTNQYKLIIIGGKNDSFSKEGYAENENVVFVGYVTDKDLVNYYHNAKCFVYPSLYEGFGLPPIEALALGTPVIASDIPSIKEVCGDSVIQYFNPYSIEEIANSISWVFIQETLPKPNFSTEKYSWKKSAEKMAAIINQYL